MSRSLSWVLSALAHMQQQRFRVVVNAIVERLLNVATDGGIMVMDDPGAKWVLDKDGEVVATFRAWEQVADLVWFALPSCTLVPPCANVDCVIMDDPTLDGLVAARNMLWNLTHELEDMALGRSA